MEIKVLNLNIWDGGRLMKNIMRLIKDENPDVLCLQEVYNGDNPAFEERFNSIDVLHHFFPQYNYYFAPTYLEVFDFGKIVQGNCIFSKFPIDERSFYFFDTPFSEQLGSVLNKKSRIVLNTNAPRNLQCASISISDKVLNIFNMQGQWGVDGLDNKKRINMAHMIAEKIHGQKNVILCGDFNVQLVGTKTVEIIKAAGVQNIFKDKIKLYFQYGTQTKRFGI